MSPQQRGWVEKRGGAAGPLLYVCPRMGARGYSPGPEALGCGRHMTQGCSGLRYEFTTRWRRLYTKWLVLPAPDRCAHRQMVPVTPRRAA